MADLFNSVSAVGYAVVTASEHAAEAASERAGAAPDPGKIMQELIEHGFDKPIIPIGWHPFGWQWLDLSITKMTLNMWIAGLLIFLLFRYLARRPITGEKSGGRFLNFLEPFVIYVRSEMVYPNMGEKLGRKFLPLFLTQFFFILFCNLLGLIPIPHFEVLGVEFPGLGTATANLAVCAGLSLTTLLTIFVMGMLEQGPVKYWKHLVPPGIPVLLIPMLFPIEVVGIFIKSFALTIRLFANMVSGHLVIFTFIGLIFIFHSYLVALPAVLFALFIYVLELFVAFLQAFIFTLLSIIFVNMAVHPEH